MRKVRTGTGLHHPQRVVVPIGQFRISTSLETLMVIFIRSNHTLVHKSQCWKIRIISFLQQHYLFYYLPFPEMVEACMREHCSIEGTARMLTQFYQSSGNDVAVTGGKVRASMERNRKRATDNLRGTIATSEYSEYRQLWVYNHSLEITWFKIYIPIL